MNRDPLRLDAIYHSHPVPRNQASLSLMGFVFDKVYFPGASLPAEGFDQKAVDREIERLKEWEKDYDTAQLIGILRFLRHVPDLKGFCEFEQDGSKIFGDKRYPQQTIAAIHDGICGHPLQDSLQVLMPLTAKDCPGATSASLIAELSISSLTPFSSLPVPEFL
ncbi:hypothetical protein JQ634_35390 [Bradyrhizobium sp. AUGA SZCCT0240]|uniref:hypothetical protein n=1 Tax=unclassified Bradyrhizobium TaxID=2631580 RepID=UPI001BAB2F8D|nr:MULTISPECIES: hypothetical protein [unclassified Bradyrhizobium]MBR1193874.1 hypothetical protein [Bradyrhizobium sp. AUGA SZCCT0160]MBR1200795.1 hypothetical protein [Bradyrhizobium sp. AUGA SZCCT0158]MBR1245130.1 hypothetical protein [Bradyrhizobium sp. AUGA SZCCT0274]MBR1258940.1 hypothetical protein [Bradyrhizobium sp. AUGA SZCCT0240]